MKTVARLWTGIFILALLSPFGLILPLYFKSGRAWGEWSREELNALLGFIPKGLEGLSSFWHAPFSNYAFKGQQAKGLGSLSLAYIISAVIGILVTVLVASLIGAFLSRKNNHRQI